MNCLEALNISPGVTSVIGSGGKTTLLSTLASDLRAEQPDIRIILATTTHFLPFTGIELYTGPDEDELASLLAEHHVVCVGLPVDTAQPLGKLGTSPIPVERLSRLGDYVLTEADGSKRLPLKAHASHEPVVPSGSNQTILVVGASGFWRPIQEVVHRPERFCTLTGASPLDEVTPALVGQAIAAEMAAGKVAPSTILLNQMDSVNLLQTPEVQQLKTSLEQAGCNLPIFGASLRADRLWAL